MHVAYLGHVSQDMQAPITGTQAAIRLRVDGGETRLDVITRIIGVTTDDARAKLIGVDPKTIRRVRQGVLGEVFIAATIAALRRHADRLAQFGVTAGFDDLFEVVTADELASV